MEMNEKRPDPMHSIVDIDGFIADGKQFDLDITLATDHRDVIYGVVKDCFKEPVKDAVVKLVEVEYKYGKKELKPVTHTFTDKEGEFVFGPLCPDKKYNPGWQFSCVPYLLSKMFAQSNLLIQKWVGS